MKRKIRLLIEYDGTAYCGWQVQRQGEKTIQPTIENAIEKVIGEQVHLYAAGRTDSGVHAFGQVAHFLTKSNISAEKLKFGLNFYLPSDVAILESSEADLDFDARHGSLGKIYHYDILNRQIRSPLLHNRVWHIKKKLDVEAMQKAADCLIGEQDFKSFQATGSSAKHSIRYIYKADFSHEEGDIIRFEIFATAFLKQMVRNIVGTLVQIGLGRFDVESMEKIIEAQNRAKAGPTAPACGLTMVKIFYPDTPPPPELDAFVPETMKSRKKKPVL